MLPISIMSSYKARLKLYEKLLYFSMMNHLNLHFSSLLQVIIVQACQEDKKQDTTTSPTREMAHRDQAVYKPNDSIDIKIRRPNTALLSATVDGSVAYRGIFTGAIADQFSMADGVTDISRMFEKASATTIKALAALSKADKKLEQVPHYQSTLCKSLILPPVNLPVTY